MKHLLIIISILLLSSPVIGDSHKGEFLYRWKTSSGIVWKGFGDKETQFVCKGEVVNGEPNGVGIMIETDGFKYVGEFKNDKFDGQGTFSLYDGQWKGDKYVGKFKEGVYHGKGTYTWSDGTKYEGEFKDGIYNGKGTLTSKDGGKFVGEWKDDKEWNGKYYEKDENIKYKYVNGKRIKQ